jgi:hypothetical protein
MLLTFRDKFICNLFNEIYIIQQNNGHKVHYLILTTNYIRIVFASYYSH